MIGFIPRRGDISMKNKKKYIDTTIFNIHIGALIISVLILIFDKKSYDLEIYFLNIIGLQLLAFVSITLPLLIHYFNYKKFNNNSIVQIDLNAQMIKMPNDKNIKFNDIKKIYKVNSYNKSFIHVGYMDLFYFEVIDKNDKSYIITCLVEENLDKYIDKNKVKLVSKFFPYIKYSEHETN